ncbi:hypothetical protein BY458DRAFT_516632 [Sporodiniella umbellata]|nr:hypothetical protein BY458DRAFT_516632 [Sporodiniella umbellata]
MSSEEYEVEAIVDHKVFNKSHRKKRLFKYLIKWLNYDDEDNTWERSDNLNCEDIVEKYWEAIPDQHPDKIVYKESLSSPKPMVIENDDSSSEGIVESEALTATINGVPEKRPVGDDSQSEDKRPRSTIYFEQQEEPAALKAKKIKLVLNESDSSTVVESSNKEKSEDENEQIVFDDSFGLDRENWEQDACKIEYIGREVEGSPLFCLLKWTDGIRSMHPLTQVRQRCPQLLIDRFVDMIQETRNSK